MPNAHAGWYFTDHVVHRTIYVQGELFLHISMNAMGPGRNGISRPQRSSADQCRSIDRCKILGGCHLAKTLPVVVAGPNSVARPPGPLLFEVPFITTLSSGCRRGQSLHLGSLRIFRPFSETLWAHHVPRRKVPSLSPFLHAVSP